MNNKDGVITRVSEVSDNLLMECYWIANLSRPNNAIMIYGCMQREVNVNKHILFAYFLNDQLRGFIKGHLTKESDKTLARIDWLFIDKNCQRSGVGTRLIQAYEAHCRNAGAGRMLVQPAPTSQAKNFYAKHGYGPCGMTYMHAKDLQR